MFYFPEQCEWSASEGHDCGEPYCEGSFGVHTAACSADQDTSRVSTNKGTRIQSNIDLGNFGIRHSKRARSDLSIFFF